MALDPTERRSRRALLASAVGGAAAVAAAQLARPLSAAAADPNDLVLNQDNPTTLPTSVSQQTADTAAFKATGAGTAPGLDGASASGAGVIGTTSTVDAAGVIGTAGDTTGSDLAAGSDLDAGIYGFAGFTDISTGIYGESTTGSGTFGYGPIGVWGSGGLGGYFDGVDGVLGVGDVGGTGVHGHAGGGTPLNPPGNTAIYGSVGSTSTQVGLEARGRIRFPDRAKRVPVLAAKSSVAVGWPGVSSSNVAIATINTNRAGRYVQSVVCTTGKVTVYLNGTVAGTTYVSVLILG
jgi:hypothetical protein